MGLEVLRSTSFYDFIYRDFLASKRKYRDFIFGRNSFEEVIPFCWFMGKLNLIGSRGFTPELYSSIDDNPPLQVQKELERMGDYFSQMLQCHFPGAFPTDAIFCPTFGDLSRSVGGASADLYFNESLYLFTSTSKPNLNSSLKYKVAALIGFLYGQNHLVNCGNINGRKVRNIILYQARYSLEYRLDIKKFLYDKQIEAIRAGKGLCLHFASIKGERPPLSENTIG